MVIHYVVLCAFAVAQPLFDLLAHDATFFVARRTQPADVVLLSLGLLIGPPLIPIALTYAARRVGKRVGTVVQFALVGLLVALTAMPILDRLHASAAGPAELTLAMLLGAGGALAYTRWAGVRAFLTVLVPAPVVFGLVFLFGSDVSKLFSEVESATPARAPKGEAPSVILLIVDELPVTSLMNGDREIDPILFPNFAALAADSTWFRNATTSHAATGGAIPALLTGQRPSGERRIPIRTDYPNTLCGLLAPTHRIVAFEWVTNLCEGYDAPAGEPLPPGTGTRLRSLFADVSVVYARLAVPMPWRDALPSIAGSWGDFGTPEPDVSPRPTRELVRELAESAAVVQTGDRTRRFRDFVASIEADQEPTLYFHHTRLIHRDWLELPSGRRYSAPSLFSEPWLDEREVALGFQRHLLSLGHLDALLGELLSRLRDTGLYETSLIVVTSDHGIGFVADEDKRKPSDRNLRGILHVPLFIRQPGQLAAERSDRNVESIDLLPTLADALGVKLTWEVDGVSAFGDAVERTQKELYFRRAGEHVVVDARLPERWSALEQRERLFGSHPSWDDVYAAGPRPELVGRATDDLVQGVLSTCRVRFVSSKPTDAMAADPRAVSAFVLGLLACDSPEAVPEIIAVAVGGVIRAVTRTGLVRGWRGVRGPGFAAVLPEQALGQDLSSLAIYAEVEGNQLVGIRPLRPGARVDWRRLRNDWRREIGVGRGPVR